MCQKKTSLRNDSDDSAFHAFFTNLLVQDLVPLFDSPIDNPVEDQYEWMETKSQGRIPIRVRCAKNHNHKFPKRTCHTCPGKARVEAQCPYCNIFISVRDMKNHIDDPIPCRR